MPGAQAARCQPLPSGEGTGCQPPFLLSKAYNGVADDFIMITTADVPEGSAMSLVLWEHSNGLSPLNLTTVL